ncbi:MAG TPA: anthrone oxygenase family protein [Thermomicrobiales bacterium]|nr:anthrone oxygenase family protein [Thermomicrobiales bacterium]
MDLTTIDGWASLTLFTATVVTGLVAGIYLAFSIAVIPGLRVSGDATFIETMQNVNTKILNPAFLVIVFGSAVLPIIAAVLLIIDRDEGARWWAAGGAMLALTAFVTTVNRNIPLSRALAAAGPVTEIADQRAVRQAFEERWVRWNHHRSLASSFALVALVAAIFGRG